MLFSVGGCRTSASGKGSHRRRRVRIHAKHSYLRSLFFSFRLLFDCFSTGRSGCVVVVDVEHIRCSIFLFFEFFSSCRVC